MKKVIATVFIMSLFLMRVSAASICSYEKQSEYNSKSANVKVAYEVLTNKVETEVEGEIVELTKSSIQVSIYNVTSDFYVTVANNHNKDIMKFTYDDSVDGVITYNWTDLNEITNLTFELYTSNSTPCPDERFRTLYLTLPKYNIFSRTVICEELKDFYLCQKFINSDVSEEMFNKKLESYQNGLINKDGENINNKKDTSSKVSDFLNNNKWYIIGALACIAIIALYSYSEEKKKQRDE